MGDVERDGLYEVAVCACGEIAAVWQRERRSVG